MTKPRILALDIETSHTVAATFQTRKAFIHHSNILYEWKVFCASYMWVDSDDREVYSVAAKYTKKHGWDDTPVIKELAKVMTDAHLITGHNSQNFDVKKIKTRALQLGLAPIPSCKNYDTYKAARRLFNFTSNRLDYIADYLDVGGKTSTPPNLWLDLLGGDTSLMEEMVHYNKNDVVIQAAVHDKFATWDEKYPVIRSEVFPDGLPEKRAFYYCNKPGCDGCGDDLMFYGVVPRATGNTLIQKFYCRKCGKYGFDTYQRPTGVLK